MFSKRNLWVGLFLISNVWNANALTTPVDMHGTVFDANTGKAVAGAAVTLTLNPSITTTTDTGGNFHLTGNAIVGIRPGLIHNGKLAMELSGTALSFSIQANNTPVSLDIFNVQGKRLQSVLNRRFSAGQYTVNAAAVGLPAGLYMLRAKIGAKSVAFKMSTLGIQNAGSVPASVALSSSKLAKAAADILDTLKVTKLGYRLLLKPISLYNTTYPLLLTPKLPPGDLKIYSDRAMNQVAWGSNVNVEVWDGGTQLNGSWPTYFEGKASWMVNFMNGQQYSAWGFTANANTPEDLSDWKGGTIHIAVLGTVSNVAVTVASPDINENSVKVDMTNYGYKPDGHWHEAFIPLDLFVGTDLSRVSVYCGLVNPGSMADTSKFNSSLYYQMDDIYYSLKK
jgi:hypothetical protein